MQNGQGRGEHPLSSLDENVARGGSRLVREIRQLDAQVLVRPLEIVTPLALQNVVRLSFVLWLLVAALRVAVVVVVVIIVDIAAVGRSGLG